MGKASILYGPSGPICMDYFPVPAKNALRLIPSASQLRLLVSILSRPLSFSATMSRETIWGTAVTDISVLKRFATSY